MATTEAVKPDIPASAPPRSGHPTGFWFIFSGELAERASFYGMKAVLTLYLIHVFAYKREDASSLVHLYVAGCYLAPLLGGLIADRLLNKYWTIVGFSVPYVFGQFIVGLSNEYLMFGALFLLALGSGVIKPNISTLMGLTYDQQRPGQEQLRSQAFGWFYVAINIGSFLSTIICPTLRDVFGNVDKETGIPADPQRGYLVAFLFPACLMMVALGFFAAGKRYYAHEELGFRKWGRPADASEDEGISKWKVVGQLLGLFLLVMFFWAIFDQHASTWILFANDYLNLRVDLGFTEFRLPPDLIQAANPFLIVCFVPLLNWMFAALARAGYKIRPTDKMTVGFLLTAASMGVHAFAGYLATQSPDGKVSVLWQLLAFVIITIAEVLISVTGLELAFTAAPKSMKSFVTALWLLTVFLANLLINASVTRMYPGEAESWLYKFQTAQGYFLMLTVLMLVVTVVFFFVAQRFNRAQLENTASRDMRDVGEAE